MSVLNVFSVFSVFSTLSQRHFSRRQPKLVWSALKIQSKSSESGLSSMKHDILPYHNPLTSISDNRLRQVLSSSNEWGRDLNFNPHQPVQGPCLSHSLLAFAQVAFSNVFLSLCHCHNCKFYDLWNRLTSTAATSTLKVGCKEKWKAQKILCYIAAVYLSLTTL